MSQLLFTSKSDTLGGIELTIFQVLGETLFTSVIELILIDLTLVEVEL
jgi:hypothetical protein